MPTSFTTYVAGNTIASAWANTVGSSINALETKLTFTTAGTHVTGNTEMLADAAGGNLKIYAPTGKTMGLYFADVLSATFSSSGLTLGGALSGVTTLGASGLATVGSLAAGVGGFSSLLSANAGLAVTGNSSVTGISNLTGGVTTSGNASFVTFGGGGTNPTASLTQLIYNHTASITAHMPTGGNFYITVNLVEQMQLGAGGITKFSEGLGSTATNFLSLLSDAAGTLSVNIIDPGTFNVKARSVTQISLGLGGITSFGSGLGATVAGNISLISDASGVLSSNVPTGGSFASKINGVSQATLNSTGLSLAGKLGNTTAANPVQFAIPTPVAVATVTATAIPGLSSTFRGCIEVQGSDGSYGRFQLPQGSTTSALVYGSATVSAGVPASTKWGIDYSSGWRYNNQTAGAITFTLIQVLTGIA